MAGVAIPARAGNFWHSSSSGDDGVPDADGTPRSRAAEGGKKHAALRVGLKCPACFVVGSRRLIIQSQLDPPPRIRDISDPSQSRPLLGQAPSNNVITIRRNENDTGQIRLNSVLVPYKPHEQS